MRKRSSPRREGIKEGAVGPTSKWWHRQWGRRYGRVAGSLVAKGRGIWDEANFFPSDYQRRRGEGNTVLKGGCTEKVQRGQKRKTHHGGVGPHCEKRLGTSPRPPQRDWSLKTFRRKGQFEDRFEKRRKTYRSTIIEWCRNIG